MDLRVAIGMELLATDQADGVHRTPVGGDQKNRCFYTLWPELGVAIYIYIYIYVFLYIYIFLPLFFSMLILFYFLRFIRISPFPPLYSFLSSSPRLYFGILILAHWILIRLPARISRAAISDHSAPAKRFALSSENECPTASGKQTDYGQSRRAVGRTYACMGLHTQSSPERFYRT